MWQETQRIFVDSAAQVLRATARILPSLLAMLLFLALSAGLAVLVRWAVRRSCERIGLDQRMREWGVAGSTGAGLGATTRVVAQVSFWAVLLAGGCLALSVIDTPAAASLSVRLVEYVPRAVIALAILGAGVAASRYVQRSVLIGAVNWGLQSARFVALGARWLVVLFAAAIALEHAGVGTGVVVATFGILFGGIVLALALAVGLGAKDLVARSFERRFPDRPSGGPAPTGEAERGQVHHL